MENYPFQKKPIEHQQAKNREEDFQHDIEMQKLTARHNWKIAIFTVIAGAIAGGTFGFLSSLVFWLLTK